MKVVFFGTSDYCLPVLKSLAENFDLKLVVTRPDKPVGRKKILTPSATKVWALENNTPLATPESLKKDSPGRSELKEIVMKIQPDLAIVSDFGLIIPEEIFQIPKLGTINIHFSKLPELRGPSPVQFTLLRGEKDAWITMFKLENPPELERKMDAGPILWQKSFPIETTDTTKTLYTRLFEKAAESLPEILKTYSENPNSLTPQDHSKATFCRFLTKEDGFIEWSVLQKAINGEEIKFSELPKIQQESLRLNSGQALENNSGSAELIYNFFQATTPWPSMWTTNGDKRIKILKLKPEPEGKLTILDSVEAPQVS